MSSSSISLRVADIVLLVRHPWFPRIARQRSPSSPAQTDSVCAEFRLACLQRSRRKDLPAVFTSSCSSARRQHQQLNMCAARIRTTSSIARQVRCPCTAGSTWPSIESIVFTAGRKSRAARRQSPETALARSAVRRVLRRATPRASRQRIQPRHVASDDHGHGLSGLVQTPIFSAA